VVIREGAELAESRDKDGLEFVDVQPSPATRIVGDNDEVDRPFGWREVGVGGRRFWGYVSRCESHLRSCKCNEDFDVGVCEDVC
jgi:hypothetical protein